MNRHTKVALFVAPFLILGGYILSDLYLENKAAEPKLYNLTTGSQCDVLAENCILSAGELKVSVYDRNGKTYINSTAPLDNATLFIVNSNTDYKSYQMKMEDNRYYWTAETDLRNAIDQQGSSQTLRLIANIKGSNYISEFVSTTK